MIDLSEYAPKYVYIQARVHRLLRPKAMYILTVVVRELVVGGPLLINARVDNLPVPNQVVVWPLVVVGGGSWRH